MAQFDVDLFIIGAGSGGVRAARIAAEHGARVMIAEEYRVGGTCVIRGCVPKKLLVYASRFAYEFEEAEAFGWTVKGRSFDWPTLIANKDKEIARLEAAYRSTLGRNKVEIVESRAQRSRPFFSICATVCFSTNWTPWLSISTRTWCRTSSSKPRRISSPR
jgi:glutathione reductase (NADPH)